MEDVNAIIDEIFGEFGIFSTAMTPEGLRNALIGNDVPEDKTGEIMSRLRHPSSTGKMIIRLGDINNFVTVHDDHLHIVSVPDSLDIEF